MNLKIFIATHKKFDVPMSKYHVPLHVGREGKEDLGYLGDNTGDNISLKNPNYCELTGLYWIWKNVKDVDYIGLCHYRRYFFTPSCIESLIFYLNFFIRKISGTLKNKKIGKERTKKIKNEGKEKYISKFEKFCENKILKYDIITSKKFFLKESILTSYNNVYVDNELSVLRNVISEKYNEYIPYFDNVVKGKKISPCNMFIFKKDIFNDYNKWLFDILFEVEKRIEISQDTYKARVFGFMSENLLDVYINYHKEYSVKRVNMLFVK